MSLKSLWDKAIAWLMRDQWRLAWIVVIAAAVIAYAVGVEPGEYEP